jgi:hypothetical protein
MLTPFAMRVCSPLIYESEIIAIDQSADFISAQYEEREPIVIESSIDFDSYGFPGNGMNSDPYIIERVNISSVTSCISISNVNDTFVIRNCILESSPTPNDVIHLMNVNNSTIEENIIIGGNQGIRCFFSSNLIFIGNTICDSGSGLTLINSFNARALDNSIYGLDTGIELVYTSHCLFSSNRIYTNTQRGFSIDSGSEFNTFSSNLIGWNGPTNERNAVDDGGNNIWFTNSWSDYIPPEPYNISGMGNSQDVLPIELVDLEGPWINTPEDVVMGEGYQATVRWIARDMFPFEYRLLLNNMITNEGSWIDDEFSFDLQYLDPGEYNITLAVADGSDNTTEDSVFVSVFPNIYEDIGTEFVAYASALTIVVFLGVLCLKKRKPQLR